MLKTVRYAALATLFIAINSLLPMIPEEGSRNQPQTNGQGSWTFGPDEQVGTSASDSVKKGWALGIDPDRQTSSTDELPRGVTISHNGIKVVNTYVGNLNVDIHAKKTTTSKTTKTTKTKSTTSQTSSPTSFPKGPHGGIHNSSYKSSFSLEISLTPLLVCIILATTVWAYYHHMDGQQTKNLSEQDKNSDTPSSDTVPVNV